MRFVFLELLDFAGCHRFACFVGRRPAASPRDRFVNLLEPRTSQVQRGQTSAPRYRGASVNLGDPKERLLIVAIALGVATFDCAPERRGEKRKGGGK